MAIMRVSHPDVIEFIHSKNKDVSLAHSLRLNDPDDYTYTSFSEALEEARELIDEEGRVPEHLRNAVEGHLSNFNISVGVTDEFMEALRNDEEYTFINPRTGEPHVATEHTEEMYARYDLDGYVTPGEELTMPAGELWDRIVQGAWENGEPGVIYLDRVNQEHSFPVDSTPTGDGSEYEILATNPCVTGETRIATADGRGSVPIETLAENGEDVPVYCLDERTGEIDVQIGRNPRLTRRNAELVTIETDGDVSLRCTPDHEVPTKNRGLLEAAALEPGDSLKVFHPDEYSENAAPLAAPAGNHRVAEVTSAGRGDVYNLTVDQHHNYFAGINVEDDVYINVLNCGEQPLMEYEACNLGHINLSTLAAADGADWRVWSDRNADDYPDLEAAVDAFLEAAVDLDELDHRIEWGTRFLENVVTMSNFPVEQIEDTVYRNRKIGLGVMGLAQLYVQLGVRYGSDVGNEIASQLMQRINHGSKWTSHELAAERGSFANWADSKYADPVGYHEWFEHQTGLDADDWADGFPIRNHNTTTVAPTGTTSMVGNTTGGIEPIYNVAYYKNVSDDVQGDEMLVEFDDYFLRVLEANDVDVETVKAEALDQMENNQFDGVGGLETVPKAIADLFVVTGEVAAKEHAAVQCAAQAGVDSAISKTVNAPNDSSLDDAKSVFEFIYDHGGKCVTYYRDGTRSKQVLTTRAQNTDFAELDEAEAAEVLLEQIEDLFGGLEGFLDHEDIREKLAVEIEEFIETGSYGNAKKRPRPDVLHGVTQRIESGYGKLYVNINEDEQGRPFELFANIGNSGGFTASFTEALAKTISTALRSGVDPEEIASELQGIRSPKVAWDKGEQIQSIPDAIGTAMHRYLDGEVEKAYPQQRNLDEIAEEESTRTEAPQPESNGGVPAAEKSNVPDDSTQSLIDAGESPECPSCGALSLYYAEGCKTCESCGWSEC
jgi:ribonucleoside-diphosphate reductase alpha chain